MLLYKTSDLLTYFWEAFPVGDVTPEKCLITPLEANMRPETEMTQLCRSYANSTKV